MAKVKPGTVRQGPDGFIAIKTGDGVTAGDWYIYHPDHGGGYGDGEAQKVSEWTPLVLQESP